MRFLVTRTSDHYESQQPCPEAEEDTYLETSVVELKSFEEWNERMRQTYEKAGRENPPTFLSEGLNHRVTEKGVARDFERRGWFVEIPDFDALLAFAGKYGSLVIERSDTKNCPCIEIYDDWRE